MMSKILDELGKGVMMFELRNDLRRLRLERGLSQQELAELAGVTRQTVSGIESGRYSASAIVALKLARALNCRVEDMFRLIPEQSQAVIEVASISTAGQTLADGVERRATVARIGDSWYAHLLPETQPLAYNVVADAVVRIRNRSGALFAEPVKMFRDRSALEHNIVVAGCDPALGLLSAHMRELALGVRLIWFHNSSRSALAALERGEVNIAGLHLFDPATGLFNVPFVERSSTDQSILIVNLAAWEQGLVVRPGNPLAIKSIADLARTDVTIINREWGSGARELLDRLLDVANIDRAAVRGYNRVVNGHMAVAQAVAAGAADVGVAAQTAAVAFNLAFIPLAAERFDLVLPLEMAETPPLAKLLDVLAGAGFRTELAALGGYQTSWTGQVIAQVDGRGRQTM